MGEAKRRKQCDPNYGKSALPQELARASSSIALSLSPSNVFSDQVCYLMLKPELRQVKIGIAINPDERRHHLQTGSSEKLYLVGFWVPATSAKFLEQEFHSLFGDLRVRGEWFKVTPKFWERFYSYVDAPGRRMQWHGPADIKGFCTKLWEAAG